jgi:adenosine deaminase
VAQRRIGIEVCLLSNQILGLVDDLRDHPYFGFVNDNLPVVLSSDDPGLWETEGVSYDWTTAFMIGGNSCANGMRLLKQLAINSIEQSLVGEAERTTMLGAWRSQWTDYVDWLLKQSAD